MQIRNSNTRYGAVSKAFHWLMAALVVGLLAVGTIMHGMDVSPLKFQLYGLHKAFGATVLALVLLRFLWKLKNSSPALPAHMNSVQKFAARAAHWVFYALLVAMPMSGWLMSSAAGFTVSVFGLFTLPDLIPANKEQIDTFKGIHEWCGIGLMVLIGLHVLAALTHHYYYKDNVLRSMLPFTKVKNENTEH